jgi:hypothetical protein
MDFRNACLFHKKPGDMRRVGALGGRAYARNLRLRKACHVPVIQEPGQPDKETAAEAIQCIDALCPWLLGVERGEARRQAGAGFV